MRLERFPAWFPLLGLALASPSWAANHALVVGGGCVDLSKDQSYFREQMHFQSDALSRMGWQTSLQYALGDPDGGESAFTRNGLLKALALNDGSGEPRFRPGDQLLLSINTHGDGGKAHSICLGNDQWMPVSDLKEALSTLARQGVRVAVIDSSCYGGGTVRELAAPGVCAISSTLDTATNISQDVGMSMIAQAAMERLKPAEQAELFRIHRSSFPNARSLTALRRNQPELDGAPGLSAEELFVTNRTFGAFGHDHRPAQISSDVEGLGFELGKSLPLSYVMPQPDMPDSRLAAPRAFIEAAYSAVSEIVGQACEVELPFRRIELLYRDFAQATETPELQRYRRALGTALARLGFSSFEDATRQMSRFVAKRRDIHSRLLKATLEYNALMALDVIPDSRLRASRQKLDALRAEDALSTRNDIYMRLEKAYYLAQYLDQRTRRKEDPRVKACSDFRF